MKRLVAILLCAGLLLGLFAGCAPKRMDTVEYVIGVSQANMREPWRLVLLRELKEEAAKHPNIRLVFTDATQDSEKQMKDIERLREYGIDLLIISPCDVKQITPVVREVYRSIPVVVLDRAVEGFDYSLFIGPDNTLIGRQAGEAVAKLLGGGSGRVLEVCGSLFSQTRIDRSKGFEAVVREHPSIEVEQVMVTSESRDAAEEIVAQYGENLKDIDVIFAHNDYMALGAYRAVKKLGYEHIRIVGIDGFAGENGGIDLVRKGYIDETITCPTGGKEAIQSSLEILGEVSGVPKQIILRSHSITKETVEEFVRGHDRPVRPYEGTITVGWSQVGTESAWRLANTQSIKDAAREFGIDLIYDNANQSQQRQLEAIREFIAQKVDVIVLSPVVDSGWDEALREAKAAGIPVLLSDRKIETSDDSLFMTYFGVDAVEEGRRAMRWLVSDTSESQKSVRILELQGTTGASPTLERKQGFEEILAEHSGYEIVYSESGDFTYEGGKTLMENYMKLNPWDIDVIFAHNDDMALGAIEALEAGGIRPGVDVKIISVDGAKPAFEAMIAGKLNCAVECSPLLGPQLMKAITDLMSGKELPLRIITDEKVYTQENAAQIIKSRKY